MSRPVKASIAAMIAATTMSAPSFADDTTEIINGQVNLDAEIVVDVTGEGDAVTTATLTGAGMGNALTVDVVTPHDVQNDQEFSGSVDTTATTRAHHVTGIAVTSATSMGNGASLIADDSVDFVSDQRAADGSTVNATAGLEIDSYVMNSVTAASASANSVDSLTYGGDTYLELRQDSGADVTADAYVLAPTGGLGWSATTASVAAGNTVNAEGYYQAPSQIVDIDQDNRGRVVATARVDSGGGSEETVISAQANGNAARIQNEDAYARLQGEQDNDGEVTAEASADIGNFDIDVVTLSAEGVGNSALISNIGSNTYMGVGQTNNAAIGASATLTGDDGGVGVASSTAFGNAATSYICSECPATAYGDMVQTNNGSVTSRTTISTGTAASMIGSAFAVGNSATFETVTPD